MCCWKNLQRMERRQSRTLPANEKGILKEKNKERISMKSNEYYHQNKETTNEKRKEPIECKCGGVFRKCDMRRHERS